MCYKHLILQLCLPNFRIAVYLGAESVQRLLNILVAVSAMALAEAGARPGTLATL